MRLIDADELLSKYGTMILTAKVDYAEGCRDIIQDIIDAPTVDAVPVVKCKDCKHWLKDIAGCTENVGRCEFANWMIGKEGYCLYGERWKDELR